MYFYTQAAQNYDNRQESILLICVRSNNHDDYVFGYARVVIFDDQKMGFE